MRILISKPDALGDQILAVGLIQALRREWPEARILWHVRPGMEVIADLLPDAAVWSPDTAQSPEAEAQRFERDAPAPIAVVSYPIDTYSDWTPHLGARYGWWASFLRAVPWDIALAPVINRTALSDFTVTASNAARRIGFTWNRACQPMMEAVYSHLPEKGPRFTEEVPASLHGSEWQHYRDLLSHVAPRAELRPPSLNATARATDDATGCVLLIPGSGANPQRAWSLERFAGLAQQLRQNGWAVRWLFGPGDRESLDSPSDDVIDNPIQLERNELVRLVSLMRSAALVVCNDTAYVHLAAALDVPTVAVFGAGQKGRFIPPFGRVTVVQGDPVCRGCQWQCAFDTPICVKHVPVEAVSQAVAQQLDAPEARHVRIDIPLPTGVVADRSHEGEWVRDWFQEELYRLRWDGWARLQIINDVIERVRDRDRTIQALGPAPRENPEAEEQAWPLRKLSIIIPMGRPERADGTLQSLRAQTIKPQEWEVVAVSVNASSLRDRYPDLPLVAVDLEKNVLPPKTRALGVAQATGDWFLFVDDDVQLAPDFFEMLVRALIPAAPTTAPVGAIGVRLPGGRGTFFEHLTDISNFWSQQSPRRAVPHSVWFLYSAAIVVRAEAYHRVGGFNVELPNGEDVDLTQRINAAGYLLAYEPSLVAYHHHGRDNLWRMWRYFWRNGNAAQYFFTGFGGVCAYSIRTVLRRTWADLQMNRAHQKSVGERLGFRIPWILINYLIVETSLEWHYQQYLWRAKRYHDLPARTKSDRLAADAFRAWESGRRWRGRWLYAKAMLLNFGDPVRR